MENVTLQSPWVRYTNSIRELFKRDPEIKMSWSDATLELKMYVDNPNKAEAIAKILPSTKEFGKNIVKIFVIPSNNEGLARLNSIKEEELVKVAFEGNPIFKRTRSFQLQTNPITYVVFKKEVLQYFEDNLDDLFGARSVLAEDLAREVLENLPAVHFSTDIED